MPERMLTKHQCQAVAAGKCIRDGETLRMCAEHGPIFEGYGRFYGGAWTPDSILADQLQLAL